MYIADGRYLFNNLFGCCDSDLDGSFNDRQNPFLDSSFDGRTNELFQLRVSLEQRNLKKKENFVALATYVTFLLEPREDC